MADHTVYSGSKDTVVPPANSKLYVQGAKLPQEHHVELPADHYSGIVFLPSIIQEIARLASEPVGVVNAEPEEAGSINTDSKSK